MPTETPSWWKDAPRKLSAIFVVITWHVSGILIGRLAFRHAQIESWPEWKKNVKTAIRSNPSNYVKMHPKRHEGFSTRCPTVDILYFQSCIARRRFRNSRGKIHISERRNTVDAASAVHHFENFMITWHVWGSLEPCPVWRRLFYE